MTNPLELMRSALPELAEHPELQSRLSAVIASLSANVQTAGFNSPPEDPGRHLDAARAELRRLLPELKANFPGSNRIAELVSAYDESGRPIDA